MKNFGFIGFGSMGKMLAEKSIETGALRPEQVTITRKDAARLEEVKKSLPGIITTESIAELTVSCDVIFICVKPADFREVLLQMKPYITGQKHIISIAGTVSIANIESILSCKISKVMPTLLTEVKEGITLVCHNSLVTAEDAALIDGMLQKIGKVKPIAEEDYALTTELTSCAPGFFAALFREYCAAAQRHSDSITREEIEEITLQTLQGTLILMLEKKMGFEEVVTRVATKGGITEEGVKVIREHLPAVFDEMFDRTLEKRVRVAEKISKDFERI